jgi:hypothetical protein
MLHKHMCMCCQTHALASQHVHDAQHMQRQQQLLTRLSHAVPVGTSAQTPTAVVIPHTRSDCVTPLASHITAHTGNTTASHTTACWQKNELLLQPGHVAGSR